MADKLVRTDDLDGSEGAERIRYAFDGKEYEIDLSARNIEQFREALSTYIEASREVERPPAVKLPPQRGRRRSTGRSTRTDIPQIRAWAQAKGQDVSKRGRIKREIIEAYDQTHS